MPNRTQYSSTDPVADDRAAPETPIETLDYLSRMDSLQESKIRARLSSDLGIPSSLLFYRPVRKDAGEEDTAMENSWRLFLRPSR